ncbi:MAG: YecH family protein [Phycisphaeraceae bacterium]|nr:MAG: YecH family protein [Phycisphaeraceae bacterium]
MPDHHAHEVMQLMADTGDTYTRESFARSLADHFGPDARFCSCCQAGMSSDDLLVFLFDRGKLSGEIDGTFRLGRLGHCGHDDHHK